MKLNLTLILILILKLSRNRFCPTGKVLTGYQLNLQCWPSLVLKSKPLWQESSIRVRQKKDNFSLKAINVHLADMFSFGETQVLPVKKKTQL